MAGSDCLETDSSDGRKSERWWLVVLAARRCRSEVRGHPLIASRLAGFAVLSAFGCNAVRPVLRAEVAVACGHHCGAFPAPIVGESAGRAAISAVGRHRLGNNKALPGVVSLRARNSRRPYRLGRRPSGGQLKTPSSNGTSRLCRIEAIICHAPIAVTNSINTAGSAPNSRSHAAHVGVPTAAVVHDLVRGREHRTRYRIRHCSASPALRAGRRQARRARRRPASAASIRSRTRSASRSA